MKILMTGSTGFVGSALFSYLESKQHELASLVRRPTTQNRSEFFWDPENGILDSNKIEGFDAIIHLAGENIMGRWTGQKKERIKKSRILGTRLLSDALLRFKKPPSVLICASAIGFYGNRGNEVLTEDSLKGEGFLSDVCAEWEEEAHKISSKSTRVVILRMGMVLSSKGGALRQILPIFKLGLGGTLGGGEQIMSWIAIDDLLHIVDASLQLDSLKGPVNAVAPHPVTNKEFTQSLASVLHRPAFFSVPKPVISLLFGQMGKEVLLGSAEVCPKKLLNAGFKFTFPRILEALEHLV